MAKMVIDLKRRDTCAFCGEYTPDLLKKAYDRIRDMGGGYDGGWNAGIYAALKELKPLLKRSGDRKED